MKNNKLFCILSGVAFSVLAVLVIVGIIRDIVVVGPYSFYPGISGFILALLYDIIYLIGCVLCAVSLFKFNPKLLISGLFGILGIAIRLRNIVLYVIYSIDYLSGYEFDFSVIFNYLTNILLNIFEIACIVFLGLFVLSKIKEAETPKTVTNTAGVNPGFSQTPYMPPEDLNVKLGRLEKLKNLQEIGAITEEEFEEKKRQILGMPDYGNKGDNYEQ